MFHNTKIAKNGTILLSHVMCKVQGVPNIMDHTNPNIIDTSLGIIKQIPKLTLLVLK